MKLSEIKGERAIEVFADLLDPVSRIVSDKEVLASIRGNDNQITKVQKILKGHSKEVIEMLAILEGIPVAEYEPDFVSLPMKLIEIFNDPAVVELFTLQDQNGQSIPSGPVTESSKENGN